MTKTILIVDDDPHILEVIEFALVNAGMKTVRAEDGDAALEQFAAGHFDLVVLDVSMPERDGLDVCREIRKTSEIPILFLSSRDEEIDRILGLEIGGDDYVTKPFSPRELVARIKVILKRSSPASPDPADTMKPLAHGQVRLDPEQHKVSWQNRSVELTATEFAILKAFLSHPQRVFERNNIIDKTYGLNFHISDRTIDSHIRHIRAKFRSLGCSAVIETVHGIGYRLADCE